MPGTDHTTSLLRDASPICTPGLTKQVPTTDESDESIDAAFERTDIDRAIETSTIDFILLGYERKKERKRERRGVKYYNNLDNHIERKEKMRCEARKIHVEYGEVEADATAVKWLEIINESCVSVLISIYMISISDQASIDLRGCV